ncbi:hypothetical protein COV23_00960 [Candidatus Wolfebacteria bacterium CG10_big_fil_rev_8_21_14_0_10_31_9]|uniref:Uncharacterized protein n=1 Tax=Candidatus Wolfebacteria bacterium CG10_big_fil_rev_8_21_14_0_10_31_9 TaxID=1975070 RepID=A0A2H0REJ6_9BACT|nr:MAG: hypothetical protein COV23_00960 [Candidatus Wolfebacteria bacterium CG10_big_fil_rev_8_21_14_0_10_31_9]
MILDKIVIILRDIIELGGVIVSWININIVGIIADIVKPAGLFIIKILEVAIDGIRMIISKV